MPRPAPHRADTKSRVIRQAARTLFLAQGFAATTLDQVAAQAGVSKATIYARYRQKEEILGDVLTDLLEEWEAPQVQLPEMRSLAELRSALLTLASQNTRHLMQPDVLRLVRMLIAEMNTQPELGELFVQAVPQPLLAQTAALLQRAETAGLLRLPDPHLAARSFVGPLMSFVVLNGLLARQPQPPSTGQLGVMVDLCLHGLLHFGEDRS
ncbi:TetR/AcrR family transcriptional regulator [Deinococcus metallilatus]|nr:TetR/AcrR family transcriptional regulator [Deinococcus metallilatus]GMA14567.1 hypothetical protein GCM10025871_08980 [Deinococcus metallilatus]